MNVHFALWQFSIDMISSVSCVLLNDHSCQQVSIREPYDLSTVQSEHPETGAAIVDRVKKVLDAERKRMN